MVRSVITILFLLPLLVFGQIKDFYREFVPKGISVKPLLDSTNYIDNKVRLVILDYLKLSDLDPSLYFIDSLMQQKGDTLSIYFWDITGLKKTKFVESGLDTITDSYGRKFRAISINGEPGNGFLIEYDRRKNKIIHKFILQ